MTEVKYKEYSEEEDRIYKEAMTNLMGSIRNGMSVEDAFALVKIEDEELKAFIRDDAIKIIIAERYFLQGVDLQQISERLGVPMPQIIQAVREMLEDVGYSSAEYFRLTHGDGALGNA
jgi:hypothetical protein